MSDSLLEHNEVPQEAFASDPIKSTSRRTFLKGAAAAGAAVSLISKVAWAEGEFGYWAQDLPGDKLTQMYTDICRIRWHTPTATAS